MSRLQEGIHHLALSFLNKFAFGQKQDNKELLAIFSQIQRKLDVKKIPIKDKIHQACGLIEAEWCLKVVDVIRELLKYDAGYLHRYIENFHFYTKSLIFVRTTNSTSSTMISEYFSRKMTIQIYDFNVFIRKFRIEEMKEDEKTVSFYKFAVSGVLKSDCFYDDYSRTFEEGEYIWCFSSHKLKGQSFFNFVTNVIAGKETSFNVRWTFYEENIGIIKPENIRILFDEIDRKMCFDYELFERVQSSRYNEEVAFFFRFGYKIKNKFILWLF